LPEPFSAERLNQLRQRWERDPKSRAFLQLAEEYRRAGRLPDALHVLKAGLEEHPTYLAAQVALGRCLVETDAPDAAIEILERAVARDPAQLVANKLLVEAYLAKRQAGKARERLDLYKLFNDRDAEIEPLEARIRALGGTASAPAGAARRSAEREMRGNTVFELPALQALPEVSLEPEFALARARAAATSDTGPREPFGALFARGAVQRIESAFAEQGIFALAPLVLAEPEPPASTPAVVTAAGESAAPAPVDWESAAWPTGSAQIEPPPAAPDVSVPPVPAAELPAESPAELPAKPLFAQVEELAAPSPAPQPGDTPRPASSTLGELYLAQGHLDEAEESFQSVLHSRPGDVAALAGLESVRLQRGDEAAAFADDLTVNEMPNVIVGGLAARKAVLLKEFLARIRRGAKRRVS
jgi:tetratricopeptide (TPR) repeat protein